MQIKDLPSSGSLAATDVLAKDASGGTTEKINGSDLASGIKALGSLLGTSDVVNNLTSTSTNPISSKGVYNALAIEQISVTAASGISVSVEVYKFGNILIINGYATIGSTALSGTGGVLFVLPSAVRPSAHRQFRCYSTYNGTDGYYSFRARPNGDVDSITGSGKFSANTIVNFDSVVVAL